MNDDVLVSILNLEISAASESLVYWWVQRCCSASVISSRSGDLGLLEYWIWPYVRGHCFGCSLRPGALQYSPWKLASYVLSWSLILPIRSNDWVVVAGLVLVHLKPIPESPTKNTCLFKDNNKAGLSQAPVYPASLKANLTLKSANFGCDARAPRSSSTLPKCLFKFEMFGVATAEPLMQWFWVFAISRLDLLWYEFLQQNLSSWNSLAHLRQNQRCHRENRDITEWSCGPVSLFILRQKGNVW